MSVAGSLAYGGFGECCEKKVDIITLGVVLVAIAGIAVFLRQAVIDNNVMGAGKRRKRETNLIENFLKGMKLQIQPK